MSYSDAINYLYNLQKHGIKLGLDNIIRLMSVLENPHESFLSVHVAGTNGKGSTSAIIASVLKAAGLRVGLFTSPHLVSFTERIRVNGEEITEDEVISLTEEIRERMHSEPVELSPTFFEVVTAMALLYFERKKIDIAVVEVGMGGRLDATNIIMPEVSVITDISYDHMEFLGNTLIEIAKEKACIIKDGIPVVISSQLPEVLEVIETKAEEKNTQVYLYGRNFHSILKKEDISGIYFDYWSEDLSKTHDLPRTTESHAPTPMIGVGHVCEGVDEYTVNPKVVPQGHGCKPSSCAQGRGKPVVRGLYLPLIGAHQMQNASVAIKTVELINSTSNPLSPPLVKGGKGGFVSLPYITQDIIRDGLKNVRWPGRLEIINEDPPILIDGAHNPAAALALADALVKNLLGEYKRIILVLGIMGDKDIKGIMKPLLPLASEIILTSPGYERAASPSKLADIAETLGFSDVQVAPAVKDAIEIAINSSLITHHPSLIVVTGSFYTIGEAKEVLGQKGVLTRLRE